MTKRALILTSALAFLMTDDIATADRAAWEPPAEIRSSPASTAALAPTDWFNRDVHGTGNVVIGQVSDVLLSPDTGLVTGLIVGVGDKDIAVPIGAVEATGRSDRNYLIIHASRQSLQNSEAVRFDGATSEWVAIVAPAL